MNKIIIIDTNIIYNDFWMENNKFKIIKRNRFNLNLKLCAPFVVREEIKNIFKKSLIEHKSEFDKSINKYEKLLNKHQKFDKINEDAIIENYTRFIDQNLYLKEFENNPEINHDILCIRAINRIKPFNEYKGRVTGYRDTLIWFSIIELIKNNIKDRIEDREYYFITKNKNDFIDKNILHPDLLKDLEESRISKKKIKIYSDFNSFFNEEILKDIEKIDDIKDKFKSDEIQGLDREVILDKVNDKLIFTEINIDLPANNDEVAYIESIYNLELTDIDDVWKLDDDEYIFNCYCRVEANFEYYVDKYQGYKSNEEFSIIDDDWTDRLMKVCRTDLIDISISITFNIDKKEIIDIQIVF